MAVGLCLRVTRADEATIKSLLVALTNANMQIYRNDRELPSPWGIRWVPDPPAASATMRDAALLTRDGAGSCGEIAAAYAAWLYVREQRPRVQLELIANGEDSWHVVAVDGAKTWDPQVIGG